MKRPECAVKNCKNGAFVLYGTKWICGECMDTIIKNNNKIQNENIERLAK